MHLPTLSPESQQILQDALQALQQTMPSAHWERAKTILSWSEQPQFRPLRLVFDGITLSDRPQTAPENYRPLTALSPATQTTPDIPYPTDIASAWSDLETFEQKIKQDWQQVQPTNQSQILLFLEKYGSHLSYGQANGKADIALVDLARSTAAIATALAQQTDGEQLLLIGGDLTGVQKFIYTISAEGALKSLRARSFFLELTTEEIVIQLLEKLSLPRSNIIYAGASKFYLLAADTPQNRHHIKALQTDLNEWLRKKFQNKVYLALGFQPLPAEDLGKLGTNNANSPLSQHWTALNQTMAQQSKRKFVRQLSDLLDPKPSHEPCKVCHDDRFETLSKLHEDSEINACKTCRDMYKLGQQLFRKDYLRRSLQPPQTKNFYLKVHNVYYEFFDNFPASVSSGQQLFLVNNWRLVDYRDSNHIPLFLGNYGAEGEESVRDGRSFINTQEMTAIAQGIQRLGYLRMDVDHLSQIFARGLGAEQTLPRLASLSRQMTYFFKVYLNSLAERRWKNIPSEHTPFSATTDRKNLLFIYAGGDDLFVTGPWNEIADFAFDVYRSFRVYTGNHPDITISAGIELATTKFPLYQGATLAGRNEDRAKDNGRDSLCFLDQVFKWEEWLGIGSGTSLPARVRQSPLARYEPPLQGIIPILEKLLGERLDLGTSKAFSRRLLSTAQEQERMLEARQTQQQREEKFNRKSEQANDEITDIQYFFHLPKIAYTLARLKSSDTSTEVRKSLLYPGNARYFRAIATWLDLLTRR